MKKTKYYFLLGLLIFCVQSKAQNVGVKTNLVADFSTTFNLAAEIGLGEKTSLDLYANYNPWRYTDSKLFKHLLIQPEARYWFCERFNGHFVGLHAHGAIFNAGGVTMPFGLWKNLKHHRYEGELYGAGISYGYQWILNRHWNLEANIGIGYAHIRYDKFECGKCGAKVKEKQTYNYFGPTKAGISLIYLF